MAKTNASFKLSKEAKRMIASSGNKTQRDIVKRAFIDAELTASQPFKNPRPRDNNGQK
jgi:hypothetical protein